MMVANTLMIVEVMVVPSKEKAFAVTVANSLVVVAAVAMSVNSLVVAVTAAL